jgi:xylulokinase
MARAVLEGVAYEAREILAGYDAMGLELTEIRLAGGATKSELWCQIQADVYGKATATLREGDCAVLGAAILGAVGAGVFSTVTEAVAATVHVDRVFQPNPERHERYTQLWNIYRTAYHALSTSGVYRSLSEVQAPD